MALKEIKHCVEEFSQLRRKDESVSESLEESFVQSLAPSWGSRGPVLLTGHRVMPSDFTQPSSQDRLPSFLENEEVTTDELDSSIRDWTSTVCDVSVQTDPGPSYSEVRLIFLLISYNVENRSCTGH